MVISSREMPATYFGSCRLEGGECPSAPSPPPSSPFRRARERETGKGWERSEGCPACVCQHPSRTRTRTRTHTRARARTHTCTRATRSTSATPSCADICFPLHCAHGPRWGQTQSFPPPPYPCSRHCSLSVQRPFAPLLLRSCLSHVLQLKECNLRRSGGSKRKKLRTKKKGQKLIKQPAAKRGVAGGKPGRMSGSLA